MLEFNVCLTFSVKIFFFLKDRGPGLDMKWLPAARSLPDVQ